MSSSPLGGSNSYVNVEESIAGTELIGTFQLRFEGETTRPISHDAHAYDIQEALNSLNSIAPSAVIVSGGESPIRPGPRHGPILQSGRREDETKLLVAMPACRTHARLAGAHAECVDRLALGFLSP